ncbi:MAG: biotin--[acetyl-CoA-carboxylase] ligase [Clostridium sp.]|nr:biotin--[acetyl-CoA-carboxylase] ligase [Clostridium sp.]
MSIKSDILKEFEKNKGETLSGAKLASALNVSRTSIWKHIEELRKDGYEITASPNKGYSLSYKTDLISAEGISPYLNDIFSNTEIHAFKTLASTNITAKELAANGAKHGTVVISEEQTAGRGRLGRNFYSPNKSGIYMSIILKPDLNFSDSVLITTAASVAICRAIEKTTGINTEIKWINDIYLKGRKVCGILTEASTDFESGTIHHIILGIGINFNTPVENFPEEIQNRAGSLFNDDSNKISRNQLCAEIINEVLLITNNLKQHDFINEYKRRSIVLDKDIIFIKNGISIKGHAIDIQNDGSLVVKKENGELEILNSGEISIRGI